MLKEYSKVSNNATKKIWLCERGLRFSSSFLSLQQKQHYYGERNFHFNITKRKIENKEGESSVEEY